MESITFFGRLLLTPTLLPRLVAVVVEVMVLQGQLVLKVQRVRVEVQQELLVQLELLAL
jgi:hypothetical protein